MPDIPEKSIADQQEELEPSEAKQQLDNAVLGFVNFIHKETTGLKVHGQVNTRQFRLDNGSVLHWLRPQLNDHLNILLLIQ